MTRLLFVAAGGAIGSALRYLVANAALTWLGPTFPWGTLAVNFAGSFLIGLVQSLATEGLVLGEDARLFLTTGVMGGLTTYSAFSYESFRYLHEGAWALAATYIVTTVVGCLAGCAAGILVARSLV